MAAVHGILLLDKPLGLSSNQALARARRLLGADKAGHTGALDPLATGMLPCCFGEATKVAGLLLGAHKAYEARIALGAATETGDREGRVTAVGAVPALNVEYLRQVLGRFIGRIRQRAPAYSALKKNGVPLYRLARRGVAVEAPEREVEIFSIDADLPADVRSAAAWQLPDGAGDLLGRPPTELAFEWPQISLRIVCGSGTYIRSLAVDLGSALGCPAHLAALRRLWVAPFQGSAMIDLDAVAAACAQGGGARLLLPVAAGLAAWPRIDVTLAEEGQLRHGRPVATLPSGTPGRCRVHGPGGGLVALAMIGPDGWLRCQRVFAPGV